MNSVNTNEIESAFNDLIEQLKDIKHQSDIAELHKENATILNQKLQEFYTFSKKQDVVSVKIFNDYYSKIKAIHESIKNQSNLLNDKINAFISSNDKIITSLKKLSDKQEIEISQIKTRSTISLVLNIFAVVLVLALLIINII